MNEQQEIERLKKDIADKKDAIRQLAQQIKDLKVGIADKIGALVRLGVCVTFKI